MMKKEQLAEMNNHELLCELVYSQQMTRLYILILTAVCVVAAVYLCVTVSSAESTAISQSVPEGEEVAPGTVIVVNFSTEGTID